MDHRTWRVEVIQFHQSTPIHWKNKWKARQAFALLYFYVTWVNVFMGSEWLIVSVLMNHISMACFWPWFYGMKNQKWINRFPFWHGQKRNERLRTFEWERKNIVFQIKISLQTVHAILIKVQILLEQRINAKLLRTMTNHKVLIKISHNNYIRNTFGFVRTQFWTMSARESQNSRLYRSISFSLSLCANRTMFRVFPRHIDLHQTYANEEEKKLCLCCTVIR